MEKVLCVRRTDFPKNWVGKKSIVKIDGLQFFRTCSKFDFNFKERQKIENDSTFKQIIPYIIIQTKDHKHIAVYKRKGSEKRLHDLWSIGIGGHINPIDKNKNNHSIKQIILSGMQRELDEELKRRDITEKPVFTGIINEEETDVGSVHIGAVFMILTNNMDAYSGGEELVDFKWLEIEKARKLNLELWSKLAFKLITN